MFATRVPEAATAGTPIPGHTESPVHTNPDSGVFGPANVSRPEAGGHGKEGTEFVTASDTTRLWAGLEEDNGYCLRRGKQREH